MPNRPPIALLFATLVLGGALPCRAADEPNGADTPTIQAADAPNTVVLKRIWRAQGVGKQLAVTVTAYTSGATVAAGSRGLGILFSSDFVGTVAGGAYNGATDNAQSFRPSGNDTLGAVVITCTAGSFRVVDMRPAP